MLRNRNLNTDLRNQQKYTGGKVYRSTFGKQNICTLAFVLSFHLVMMEAEMALRISVWTKSEVVAKSNI